VLPTGRTVASMTLNGAPAGYSLVTTARGQEVRVAAGGGTGVATLVVKLA
jgi:hypothetical protein